MTVKHTPTGVSCSRRRRIWLAAGDGPSAVGQRFFGMLDVDIEGVGILAEVDAGPLGVGVLERGEQLHRVRRAVVVLVTTGHPDVAGDVVLDDPQRPLGPLAKLSGLLKPVTPASSSSTGKLTPAPTNVVSSSSRRSIATTRSSLVFAT